MSYVTRKRPWLIPFGKKVGTPIVQDKSSLEESVLRNGIEAQIFIDEMDEAEVLRSYIGCSACNQLSHAQLARPVRKLYKAYRIT